MGRRRKGRPVTGWLCLDKTPGRTSTDAVNRVRRLFGAARAGHAGTLDPLATGILPIALGEATKTVPAVQASRKIYRFTVRWGVETNTDDAEGEAVETSTQRPQDAEIEALLGDYIGEIMQRPPAFSAIKVAGERAYDLAREGAPPELAERPVEIDSLVMTDRPDPDHSIFECVCGTGTYVRALARDMGRQLGCRGHVVALRRLAVGPFVEAIAIPLSELEAAHEEGGVEALDARLLPLGFGLVDVPEIAVNASDAMRIGRGQSVLVRGRDAPILSGEAHATHAGGTIALGEMSEGAFHPRRVFIGVG
ncbi:MAG: tRNA pseudouridine(55) synthase TruB [Alphaproteobacteria bacterium]